MIFPSEIQVPPYLNVRLPKSPDDGPGIGSARPLQENGETAEQD